MPAVPLPDLVARLRQLCRYAEGRAGDAWLKQTADALLEALLELQQVREVDPELAARLDRDRRLVRAWRQGVRVPQLVERFRVSRRTAYRILCHAGGTNS